MQDDHHVYITPKLKQVQPEVVVVLEAYATFNGFVQVNSKW